MSVAYLFRSHKEMPTMEKSIRTRQRKVLDVGCGAGSHSLYLQNELSLEVTAIDISSNAIQACSLRGIKDARVQDVMTLENETYDTILLLMNGACVGD
jgi:2-polyprenyl-3-methyl-5-hydroxy-6-metoxy-1,4-benzoquinol methylase